MDAVESTTRYLPIEGYPGYRVSDNGTVEFCWVNCRWGRRMTERWKKMKPGTHRKGYLYVNLTPPEGGKYKTFRVHRLILEAFVGPCPQSMECRHLNGIKTDCRLSNLCWGTQEENRQDNHDAGVYGRGEGHSQAKLTEEKVRHIRKRHAEGAPQKEIAKENNITASMVSMIVRRKSWKHVD